MGKLVSLLKLSVTDFSKEMSTGRKTMTLLSTILISGSLGYLIITLDKSTTGTTWFSHYLVPGVFCLGLFIMNAVFTLEIREKQEYKTEMEIARKVQTALLPRSLPEGDRFAFAASQLPARAVGGDYYDAIPLDDGSIALVIADVSGKGACAAILMSNIRSLVRTYARSESEPDRIVGLLNDRVTEDTTPDRFVTLFYGVVDPESGVLRYAGAGHDPPLLVRADGSLERLEEGGTVLGVAANLPFRGGRTEMASGDSLLLYTDGVTEAMDRSGGFFGIRRVEEVLAGCAGGGAAAILSRLRDEIDRFRGGAERSDDETILLFSLKK